MADQTDSATAPETHPVTGDPLPKKRPTPAEVFDVVADQEDDLEEIRNLARAISSCAHAGNLVGFDGRDCASMLVLVAEIDRRVSHLEELRSKAWDGLWHYKHGRRRATEEGASL